MINFLALQSLGALLMIPFLLGWFGSYCENNCREMSPDSILANQILAALFAVLILISIPLSIILLRKHKISFWVPLACIIVSIIAVLFVMVGGGIQNGYL